MKSITSAEQADPAERRRRTLATLLKTVAGILVLAALLYFGSIDFSALAALLERPWSIAMAAVLVLLTLPLAALRWGIILRLLDAPLPPMSLLHIQCIATITNQLMFGPASADAVRGLYAWRALRGKAGVVAASLLADRIFGLMGLIALGGLAIAIRWPQMRVAPQFAVLLYPLACGFAALIAGCAVLLIAPSAIRSIAHPFAAYPRIGNLLDRVQESIVAIRRRPLTLLAVLTIAFAGHCVSVLAFLIIALAMQIGPLSAIDHLTAAPLAFMANAVPLTAGGLGVGEAAFDQICRWLEPAPSGAAYASIFFAYRAVSTLVLMVGLISFVVYRVDDANRPSAALLREDGERSGADV